MFLKMLRKKVNEYIFLMVSTPWLVDWPKRQIVEIYRQGQDVKVTGLVRWTCCLVCVAATFKIFFVDLVFLMVLIIHQQSWLGLVSPMSENRRGGLSLRTPPGAWFPQGFPSMQRLREWAYRGVVIAQISPGRDRTMKRSNAWSSRCVHSAGQRSNNLSSAGLLECGAVLGHSLETLTQGSFLLWVASHLAARTRDRYPPCLLSRIWVHRFPTAPRHEGAVMHVGVGECMGTRSRLGTMPTNQARDSRVFFPWGSSP